MSTQRVGIVGDESLAATVERVGAEPVVGATDGVDTVVAADDTALTDLAIADVEVPVLPVDASRGVRSIRHDALEPALERVLDGEYSTQRHPVLVASAGDVRARALFDVLLVAAEPARISEYAVRCTGDLVSRFRADGVVASTPAGSVGYNSAADGPIVSPETDVLAVVPIAPFATEITDWVVPANGLSFSVERDETPVELLADGRRVAAVDADTPVALSSTDSIEVVVVPESGSFYVLDAHESTYDC